jgi:hypothetical protein
MWQNPDATAEFIEENMDGNLCRCTGYRPILDAARTLVRPGRVEAGTSLQYLNLLRRKNRMFLEMCILIDLRLLPRCVDGKLKTQISDIYFDIDVLKSIYKYEDNEKGNQMTHMSPKVGLIDLCWTPERWIDLALSCELMCND